MKLFQSTAEPQELAVAEFRSDTPDNLLRVENAREGGVVIRAARDNFDSTRQRTFFGYLKAEGFIPKGGRLVAGDSPVDAVPMGDQVLWVCDPCWPYADARFNPHTRRQCRRLLLGPMLAWSLWMWMVAFR